MSLTPGEQASWDRWQQEIYISKSEIPLEELEKRDYAKSIKNRKLFKKPTWDSRKIQTVSKFSPSNIFWYCREDELSEQDIEREVEYWFELRN